MYLFTPPVPIRIANSSLTVLNWRGIWRACRGTPINLATHRGLYSVGMIQLGPPEPGIPPLVIFLVRCTSSNWVAISGVACPSRLDVLWGGGVVLCNPRYKIHALIWTVLAHHHEMKVFSSVPPAMSFQWRINLGHITFPALCSSTTRMYSLHSRKRSLDCNSKTRNRHDKFR
jgi:hypothetical protein